MHVLGATTVISTTPQVTHRQLYPETPTRLGDTGLDSPSRSRLVSNPDIYSLSSSYTKLVYFGQGFDFGILRLVLEGLNGKIDEIDNGIQTQVASTGLQPERETPEAIDAWAQQVATVLLEKWQSGDQALVSAVQGFWGPVIKLVPSLNAKGILVQQRLEPFLEVPSKRPEQLKGLMAHMIALQKLGLRERIRPIEAAINEGRISSYASLAHELGPIGMKIGQFVPMIPNVVKEHVISDLKTLNNKVPSQSAETMQAVINSQDFQAGNFNEQFSSLFLEHPIGSASMAQAHQGELKTGDEVAVKIIRDNTIPSVEKDLLLAKHLGPLLDILVPEMSFSDIIRDTVEMLGNECNMLKEGKLLEEARRVYADVPNIVIPEVFWELTSERVLTMSYFDGKPVDDFVGNSKIAKQYFAILMDQIFKYGLFQGDPKPGNVLYNPEKEKFGLIDGGEIIRISPEERVRFARLFIAYQFGDIKGLTNTLLKDSHHPNRKQFEESLQLLWQENHQPDYIAKFLGLAKIKAAQCNLDTHSFKPMVWVSLFCARSVTYDLLGTLSDAYKQETIEKTLAPRLLYVIWRHNPSYLPRVAYYGMKLIAQKAVNAIREFFNPKPAYNVASTS